MKKIIILSTDTLHHRFFINLLEEKKFNILYYLLETTSIKPKFSTTATFEKRREKFEKKFFLLKLNLK